MVPLYFVSSVDQALWGAAVIGLAGGVASAAYVDLLMRSAPKGLQGTIMMTAGTPANRATRTANGTAGTAWSSSRWTPPA